MFSLSLRFRPKFKQHLSNCSTSIFTKTLKIQLSNCRAILRLVFRNFRYQLQADMKNQAAFKKWVRINVCPFVNASNNLNHQLLQWLYLCSLFFPLWLQDKQFGNTRFWFYFSWLFQMIWVNWSLNIVVKSIESIDLKYFSSLHRTRSIDQKRIPKRLECNTIYPFWHKILVTSKFYFHFFVPNPVKSDFLFGTQLPHTRYVTLRYVRLRYVTLRYLTLRYVTLRYVFIINSQLQQIIKK